MVQLLLATQHPFCGKVVDLDHGGQTGYVTVLSNMVAPNRSWSESAHSEGNCYLQLWIWNVFRSFQQGLDTAPRKSLSVCYLLSNAWFVFDSQGVKKELVSETHDSSVRFRLDRPDLIEKQASGQIAIAEALLWIYPTRLSRVWLQVSSVECHPIPDPCPPVWISPRVFCANSISLQWLGVATPVGISNLITGLCHCVN